MAHIIPVRVRLTCGHSRKVKQATQQEFYCLDCDSKFKIETVFQNVYGDQRLKE